MVQEKPDLVLIFSGKRKSGKDYVFEKLADYIKRRNSSDSTILVVLRKVVLSSQLKKIYAQENNLDYEKLLDSSSYKEDYRLDMIRWSDLKRAEDPWYFCRKSTEAITSESSKEGEKKFIIWAVTDARRKTDFTYFRSQFSSSKIKTVRVKADESVRIQRNWKFTPGIDDSISECGLDDITDWDFIVLNNNETELNETFQRVINYISSIIATS